MKFVPGGFNEVFQLSKAGSEVDPAGILSDPGPCDINKNIPQQVLQSNTPNIVLSKEVPCQT